MKTCPVCDSDYPDQHNTCPSDGAVLIVSHELGAGSLVRGKYRIVRKLGQGGMGVVYLAEHILLGGQVALKFLAGDLGKDPKFIKRFRMEARASHQLRHPNIVEVIDLDQSEDGSLFIAMEFIEGPSLRAVVEEAPSGLELQRALAITQGIAAGLAAAHAHNTVHRDIKPENILLVRAKDGREVAKVLDFGIAAMADSSTRVSRTHGFLLTPDYAAPEQWLEMPADQMDGRTDMYALGCVFYEMLTGRTPFHAHNTSGWMKAHLEETPKPPSELRPELANLAGLDGLAMRLLAKNRDDRPQDAELLSQFDRWRFVQGIELPANMPEAKPALPVATPEAKPASSYMATVVRPATPQPPAESKSSRSGTVVEEAWERPKTIAAESQWTPVQPVIPEPEPEKKKFPAWAWAAVGIPALGAAVAAVIYLAPHPQPQQPQLSPAVQQQLSAPVQTQTPVTSPASTPVSTPTLAPDAKPSTPSTVKPADQGKKPPQLAEIKPVSVTPIPSPQPKPAPPQLSAADLQQQANALLNANRSSEAAPLLNQACNMGVPAACVNLGVMYAKGNGVSPDDSKAASLYTQACNAGSAQGCTNIANLYFAGRGVQQDYHQAVLYFRQACQSNNGAGCGGLGLCNQLGLGFPQRNPERARELYQKGCDLHDDLSCTRLSRMKY
jgi:serine/threonine-protein kinase